MQTFALSSRSVLDAQVAADAFESVTLAHMLMLSPALPDAPGAPHADAGGKGKGKVVQVAEAITAKSRASHAPSLLERWWRPRSASVR